MFWGRQKASFYTLLGGLIIVIFEYEAKMGESALT